MSEVSDAPDGLTQVRDLIARNAQPAIGRTLDFALVDAERGKAVFEGIPGEMHFNPMGGVHGGHVSGLHECSTHSLNLCCEGTVKKATTRAGARGNP